MEVLSHMTPDEVTLGSGYRDALIQDRIHTVHDDFLSAEKHGVSKVQQRLWKYINAGEDGHVLNNTAITSDMMVAIIRNNVKSKSMMASGFAHPFLSEDAMWQLIEEYGTLGTLDILRNQNCPESVIEHFQQTLSISSEKFALFALQNPNLPQHMVNEILKHHENDERILRVALANADVSVDMLSQYANKCPTQVIQNDNTPSRLIIHALNADKRNFSVAILHQQITPSAFAVIVEESMAHVIDAYEDLIDHPFMTKELLQKIINNFPDRQAFTIRDNPDFLTKCARTGDFNTLSDLIQNPITSATDLKIIYERTQHGDLHYDCAEYDANTIIPYVLGIVRHRNTSVELAIQCIQEDRERELSYYGIDQVFLRATEPKQFLRYLTSSYEFTPIDYLSFIRNPHVPFALFPFIGDAIGRSSSMHPSLLHEQEVRQNALNEFALIQEIYEEELSAQNGTAIEIGENS